MEPHDFGWISLLPPLVAIGLAVWTRHVFLSLFTGILVGGSILNWDPDRGIISVNPLEGFVTVMRDFVVPSVGNTDNAAVLILLVCISGFVALMQLSGAMTAFAFMASRHVTNPLRAHVAVWFSGLVIFFSDTANTLILGPVYTPIFDRLRISREKLAYLIDSTASPVAVLVPTTSWGAYIMGLIIAENANMTSGEAMKTLVSAIPYQFYALGSLALILILAFFKTDFGPMRGAERRVAETGELFRKGATPLRIEVPQDVPEDAANKAWTMGWGLIGLFAGTIVMFLYTGGVWDRPDPTPLKDAISNADGTLSVMLGFIVGSLVIGGRMIARKTKGTKVVDEWIKGGAAIFPVLAILVFAWSLGAICNNDNLGTAGYVTQIAQQSLPVVWIPAVIFLVGAAMSFATGTSWGSYAILMPIAIPLGNDLGISQALVIGSVLSGGLFGDHCSPISDTTILASIGSASDLMDHVRTQLPYALLAALAAAIAYYVAAKTGSAWGLAACIAVLVAFVAFIWMMRRGRASAST
ncbi:MAG: hypothetical protein IH944_07635 [Armatimonadetes bacterium]|nr:hypothetical protein [Armatimonadota bacterium]